MMNNKVRILITGDFCPVNRINKLITDEQYESIFNDFLPIIREKELAITNLECPLTNTVKKINKIGPSLKASLKTAQALSYAGFNLVTLANNHIMDYGLPGLKSTLQACKNNGIDCIGAGVNYREAKTIYYKHIKNQIVAILNFAENEFSTTNGNQPGANPVDMIDNYHDIIEAKANADYVIVIVHGGHEMFDLPSPRIKKTFRFYADSGASAIIGHHAHCYSGYEIYKGKPIFYGLGNFIFDKPAIMNSIWNSGFAVEIILDNTLTYNIIPYEQCNQHAGIKLICGPEAEFFHKKIAHLNSIIANDDLLNNAFDKYCDSVSKMYLSFLEPHSNPFIHFLRNRNFFPSLLSKRKKILYSNLINCESHRDVIIKLLDSKVSTQDK